MTFSTDEAENLRNIWFFARQNPETKQLVERHEHMLTKETERIIQIRGLPNFVNYSDPLMHPDIHAAYLRCTEMLKNELKSGPHKNRTAVQWLWTVFAWTFGVVVLIAWVFV